MTRRPDPWLKRLKNVALVTALVFVALNLLMPASAQGTGEGASVEWLDVFREYGAIAVLLFFVIGWFRGSLYGAKAVEKIEKAAEDRFNDMRSERDVWRDLALNGTDMARRAVSIAEKVTDGG